MNCVMLISLFLWSVSIIGADYTVSKLPPLQARQAVLNKIGLTPSSPDAPTALDDEALKATLKKLTHTELVQGQYCCSAYLSAIEAVRGERNAGVKAHMDDIRATAAALSPDTTCGGYVPPIARLKQIEQSAGTLSRDRKCAFAILNAPSDDTTVFVADLTKRIQELSDKHEAIVTYLIAEERELKSMSTAMKEEEWRKSKTIVEGIT